jgi:hypothetical protein
MDLVCMILAMILTLWPALDLWEGLQGPMKLKVHMSSQWTYPNFGDPLDAIESRDMIP